MNKNFIVADDAVGIEIADQYFDLHNDFGLSEMVIGFGDKRLRLRFTRYATASPSAKASVLELRFEDVDYLNLSAGFVRKLPHEVDEFGYKQPDDFDHDWLMRERHAAASDHLFFRFAEDEFIRVHSQSVTATFELAPRV